MGRKRKSRVLEVYVGTSRVGSYRRGGSGAISFRYDENWLGSERAFPVSLSLPLSDRVWAGDRVTPVFDGLLPDDRTVRDKIAARERAESSGTFDLLAAIGRDCVGALRFVPEGHDPGDPAAMTYRSIDDGEIAKRLKALATAPLGMVGEPDDEDFRISLAGMQEKTAFLYAEDGWQLPLGPTPTSHILKPAMREGPQGADFSDSPWNEWLCLRICGELGLAAASSEVVFFDDKPVLIVERFDRLWRDGVLYRLPQEDMCQALGIGPIRRYESDGGPGILAVLEFLNGAAVPRKDRLAFLRAQIVFWLLAATDGHAKNFSVFLSPGGFSLTPLYDVMSVDPYPELEAKKVKMAMAVGDNRHYRVHEIVPRHFYQMARLAGVVGADIDELFADVKGAVGPALDMISRVAAEAGAPEEMTGSVLAGVDQRARLIA